MRPTGGGCEGSVHLSWTPADLLCLSTDKTHSRKSRFGSRSKSIRRRCMTISREETRRSPTNAGWRVRCHLRIAGACTRLGQPIRPDSETQEEDAEAKHYQESERRNHRSN